MRYAALALTVTSLIATGYLAGRASNPVRPPSSKDEFIPQDLSDAKMMACGIGGNPDKTTDAFVVVEFVHGEKPYRPLIGRYSSMIAAIEGCRTWWVHVQSGIHEQEAIGKRGAN